MSIFGSVESGTSWLRSRFSKSISKAIRYDCRFGELVPVLRKFMVPGDVARIGGDVLVRFQPMMAPTLTKNTFKVRYFFVPLRLLDDNTELIITGSKNGKVYTGTLPMFPAFLVYNTDSGHTTVPKYGFWDYMGVQTGNYSAYLGTGIDRSCLPTLYWHKAYARIWYDYYRDENLQADDDFENWYNTTNNYPLTNPDAPLLFVNIRKDYFSSALPWQLKTPSGISPSIVFSTGAIDWTNLIGTSSALDTGKAMALNVTKHLLTTSASTVGSSGSVTLDNNYNSDLLATLNKANVTMSGSIDTQKLRDMVSQQRIFERLARTGSRYVEYLRANFGIAPSDETLQRAQYLGGWSIPIVTTEVLQTAQGSQRVGTMYGHGITRGGNRINTFHCKEFGLLFGLAHVIPDTEYTTGIPRELTYKQRWDFFNPSFQHLSEQEVRKGELYFGNNVNDDNATFGFQAIYNELRTDVDRTVADLRDGLKFWTQALEFASRPNLNEAFIKSSNHLGSYNKPFQFTDSDTQRPCIILFQNYLDFYRPMVRYGTPGLVDHL